MSSDLRALVADVLAEMEWPHAPDEEADRLLIPVRGESGIWECHVIVLDDEREVLVLSMLPVDVPPERRAAVAEAINRANYGLRLGNFEMDHDDGEVRFRTSVNLDGAVLSGAVIRTLLEANAQITDAYLSALGGVADGSAEPADAIAAAEGA
jgi:hypothetical protein